ncbi:predicted protein [Plenodomus lingam JN3]|uniref:Predicted protein n=1 Tax=Leptosphaeria maculans (strain JN3 / isolate v23.1.3 / race Av1-4-5-6-7-8) TaxID=985895 RepID=E4ZJN2_LEPMJ|nr:predicted protein [Plenodomus lingam JN3]CBX91317.1 predicted protein [Plenodomus lingam JN3]
MKKSASSQRQCNTDDTIGSPNLSQQTLFLKSTPHLDHPPHSAAAITTLHHSALLRFIDAVYTSSTLYFSPPCVALPLLPLLREVSPYPIATPVLMSSPSKTRSLLDMLARKCGAQAQNASSHYTDSQFNSLYYRYNVRFISHYHTPAPPRATRQFFHDDWLLFRSNIQAANDPPSDTSLQIKFSLLSLALPTWQRMTLPIRVIQILHMNLNFIPSFRIRADELYDAIGIQQDQHVQPLDWPELFEVTAASNNYETWYQLQTSVHDDCHSEILDNFKRPASDRSSYSIHHMSAQTLEYNFDITAYSTYKEQGQLSILHFTVDATLLVRGAVMLKKGLPQLLDSDGGRMNAAHIKQLDVSSTTKFHFQLWLLMDNCQVPRAICPRDQLSDTAQIPWALFLPAKNEGEWGLGLCLTDVTSANVPCGGENLIIFYLLTFFLHKSTTQSSPQPAVNMSSRQVDDSFWTELDRELATYTPARGWTTLCYWVRQRHQDIEYYVAVDVSTGVCRPDDPEVLWRQAEATWLMEWFLPYLRWEANCTIGTAECHFRVSETTQTMKCTLVVVVAVVFVVITARLTAHPRLLRLPLVALPRLLPLLQHLHPRPQSPSESPPFPFPAAPASAGYEKGGGKEEEEEEEEEEIPYGLWAFV